MYTITNTPPFYRMDGAILEYHVLGFYTSAKKDSSIGIRKCLEESRQITGTPYLNLLRANGYICRYSEVADGTYGTDVFVLCSKTKKIMRVDVTNNPNKEYSGSVFVLKPWENDTWVSLYERTIGAMNEYGRTMEEAERMWEQW